MRKEKTWKQIEQDRNRRLTVTNIIIPVATGVTGILASSPSLRYSISRGFRNVKDEIKKKCLDIKKRHEDKKLKKAEKSTVNTKTKIAILTRLNEIEILCDSDQVMAKTNDIRKLLEEA